MANPIERLLSDSYCADPANAIEGATTRSAQAARRIAHPLCKLADPEMREVVVRAVAKWNQGIRDQLREETRYKFFSEHGSQAVPVRIVDGVPDPFASILEGIDILLLELLLCRRGLDDGARSLNRMLPHYEYAAQWLHDQEPNCMPPNLKSVQEVVVFMERLSKALSKIDFESRFKSVSEDLLGAYFFHLPKIELYWIPITLTAKLLNVSVEGLTVVVLAHELAHAYTHLGYDIDGRDWNTKEFAATSLEVVEGLAQFYTCVVTRNLARRDTSPFDAYVALLKLQGGPYCVHTDWGDKDMIREVIRSVMNETRAKGIKKYSDFVETLNRHADQLGRKDFLGPNMLKKDKVAPTPVAWRIGIINHQLIPDPNAPIEYHLSNVFKTKEEARAFAKSWNKAEREDSGMYSDLAVVEAVYP